MELRHDWAQLHLGDAIALHRGYDLPSQRREQGNVPIVSSSGVSDFHSAPMVAGPGVVTGRYGTIGEVFYVESDFWPLNTTLFVSDFKGNDPFFISYMLRTIDFQTHSGKSGVPGVNRNDLHQLDIALPPLPEQRAIAAALGDVDALLAAQERLIAKQRALKQAAMQQLLTGRTRLPGFAGEWESATLAELFTFGGGFSASRDQLSSDGYCYLHYGDIHKSAKTYIDVAAEYQSIPRLQIALNRVSPGSLLADGDVVFVDASEDDDGASKHVVVVNVTGIPYISGLHTIVAKQIVGRLDHGYLRYCFQTADVKRQFRYYAVGTKVTGISKANVANINIPIPPLPEQRAIAAVLSDMDAELAALEAQRAKTRLLKQAMMQELLTGRIRLV